MIAHKFLAKGAISPFTRFRWPGAGEWVSAPVGKQDAWVHACRMGDLPYWLDDELWRVELDDPVSEARYQIASPRARLAARVEAWDPALGREYARACALRARDLALPHVPLELRTALEGVEDLQLLADAVDRSGGSSRASELLSDAAKNALHVGPATTSYVACTLAAALGGELLAFEAERAWQARWLVTRLALGDA